jgi:hypothetical protein
MLNPSAWALANAGGLRVNDPAGSLLFNFDATTTNYTANFLPFVIDPLGVGDGDPSGTTSLGPSFPWPGSASTAPAPPLLPRLTLGPGLAANARVAMADSIFRCQDDLAFNTPTDENLLPSQLLQGNARRLSQGDYSWLATVAPDPDLVDPTNPFSQPLRVSIAVFYKRPLGAPGGGERLCDLSYPNGTDGEVELQLTTPAAEYGTDGAAHLDVKPGQWIMFVGQHPTTNRWDFRWQRIVSADATTGTGPWKKRLTVAGPGWPAAYTGGKAFLFDGIINVYEQMMKLETDSMYQ